MKRRKKKTLSSQNWNAALTTLSNWLLALSVGATGTGFTEIVGITNRLGLDRAAMSIGFGLVTITMSCVIHYMKRDTDHGSRHNKPNLAYRRPVRRRHRF